MGTTRSPLICLQFDESGQQRGVTVDRFHDDYAAHGGNLDLIVRDVPWAERLLLRGFAGASERAFQHDNNMVIPYGAARRDQIRWGAALDYRSPIWAEQVQLETLLAFTDTQARFFDLSLDQYDWRGNVVRARRFAGEAGDARRVELRDRIVTARLLAHWAPRVDQRLTLSAAPTLLWRDQDARPGNGDPSLRQRDAQTQNTAVIGLAWQAAWWRRRVESELFAKRYQGATVAPLGPLDGGGEAEFTYGLTVLPNKFGALPVHDVEVVGNGTALLNLRLMPAVGYSDRVEHKPRWKRRRYGLPLDWTPPNPRRGRHQAHATRNLGWVRDLDVTLRTRGDQIGLHGGERISESMEDGWHVSRYRNRAPMRGWSPVVSGRYVVHRAEREGVIPVELYHDPDHTWVIEAWSDALLDALGYFKLVYGEPPMGVMRLAENAMHYDGQAARGGLARSSEIFGWKTDLRLSRGEDLHQYAARILGSLYWGSAVIPANLPGAKILHAGVPFWSASVAPPMSGVGCAARPCGRRSGPAAAWRTSSCRSIRSSRTRRCSGPRAASRSSRWPRRSAWSACRTRWRRFAPAGSTRARPSPPRPTSSITCAPRCPRRTG